MPKVSYVESTHVATGSTGEYVASGRKGQGGPDRACIVLHPGGESLLSSDQLSTAVTSGCPSPVARKRVPKVLASITLSADDMEYEAFGVRSSGTAGPMSGLAFAGTVPPTDTPLAVQSVRVVASDAAEPLGKRFQHVCFMPGTLIRTANGLRPIETLEVGDLVRTRDHGPQPLRWIGRHRLNKTVMALHPELRPVLIRKNSIAPGVPARDLSVSPNHRVFLNDWRAELLFGTPEVLAPAHALINDSTILRHTDVSEVEYIHLMFDRHEVIRADGLEAESFHPAGPILNSLDAGVRSELFALFPGLMFGRCGDPARRMLRTEEARAILRA